jgi:dipeptidase E
MGILEKRMVRRLLLVSSSKVHGSGFLQHCGEAIARRFSGLHVLFVPLALADHDRYAATARDRFAELGIPLTSIHQADDPCAAVENAEGVFIGGGNTFRLLDALYRLDLLEVIRRRCREGMPYMGSSAGTNMACPTIKTTNDMPIIQPPSFAALGLVPFQINPHYLDADPNSTHQGETREIRLREYLEENETPVIGLREGSWLWIDDDRCRLEGLAGAIWFQRYQEPREISVGDEFPIETGWN